MKEVNFSVSVVGTEEEAELIFSDNIKHLDIFALFNELLKYCYNVDIDGVSKNIQRDMIDKMIQDVRQGT
jgi:hypothetical protein